MKIHSITIRNFRSYYDETVFEIGDGLTLIIGDNGDGKTTFYEALEWLFDTTDKSGMNKRYISQKRISTLIESQSDFVKVSMEFDHFGPKTLEKSFRFTRDFNGDIKTSDFSFRLLTREGSENIEIPGKSFDRIFDFNLRNYSLFKGESQLDVFNNKDSLNFLVEKFSDVTNFDPYISFAEEATNLSQKALNHATAADRKIAKDSATLSASIKSSERRIADLINELRTKQREATNYSSLLDNIEKSKEASALMKDLNDRIINLKNKRATYEAKIKENYTVRLLDEMWVLCGFAPIARLYADKVSRARIARTKLENEYQQTIGANKKIQEIQSQLDEGKVPLPLHIPTEAVMREMINEEICKVCGRPAPKGSEAYEFMRKRLNDYLESLKKRNGQAEEETLFPFRYIQELEKRDTLLNNEMSFLSILRDRIIEDMQFNQSMKDKVAEYDSQIAKAEEEKKKVLSQSNGLSEIDLMNAFENISNWWEGRATAEKRIVVLESQLKAEKDNLNQLRDKYENLAKNSSAAIYSRSASALRKIFDAFVNAKESNKREFMNNLETIANEYLDMLNEGDFKGVIRIIPYPDGSVKSELYDNNDVRIYNPNTALNTTMHMAVLFAISRLTTIKKENDYPLIFDAPTSSFASAKEVDFFKVIASINKQTIIVTKSFLRLDENGRNVVDRPRISEINGTIYRIAKAVPFDDKNLSTIQIETTKLK